MSNIIVKYKNEEIESSINNNQNECFICSDNKEKLVLVENNITITRTTLIFYRYHSCPRN